MTAPCHRFDDSSFDSSKLLPCALHKRLKLATRHAHARIEDRMPFGAAHFDVSSYRQMLAAFHGFYRPMEEQLSAPARAVPGLQWGQRIKLPWLAMDLQALGMTADDIESLPTCGHLPVVESPSRVLGCLYVLEGSTLGGQLIRRLLRDRLGAAVPGASAFFGSYGPEVGMRWRSFLACLDALQGGKAADQAECAALETFRSLEHWLEQRGVLQ